MPEAFHDTRYFAFAAAMPRTRFRRMLLRRARTE